MEKIVGNAIIDTLSICRHPESRLSLSFLPSDFRGKFRFSDVLSGITFFLFDVIRSKIPYSHNAANTITTHIIIHNSIAVIPLVCGVERLTLILYRGKIIIIYNPLLICIATIRKRLTI